MSRRVLVADDSTTIQKVIKIAFSRHELEIIEAASLIESLTAVTRTQVDALILDASLPGARGPEDFSKLRAEAGDAPALLLIGTYDSVDEAAFRKAGFVHFLKKPFESSDIISTLDMLLGAGSDADMALTPYPPLGRPQHPTMIVAGGAYDSDRPSPEMSHPNLRFSGDEEEAIAPPPPPPATDQARKGRRVFNESEDNAKLRAGAGSDEATDPRRALPAGKGPSPLPPIPAATAKGIGLSSGSPQEVPGAAKGASDRSPRRESGAAVAKQDQRALDEELPILVRQAVEDYCERHFKSLAREVIATELRRLADEKARHLVDN